MTPGNTAAGDLREALFGASAARTIATPALIQAMIASADGISDLILSPGRPPQVERHGNLVSIAIPDLPVLRPLDTAGFANDLIGSNCMKRRWNSICW